MAAINDAVSTVVFAGMALSGLRIGTASPCCCDAPPGILNRALSWSPAKPLSRQAPTPLGPTITRVLLGATPICSVGVPVPVAPSAPSAKIVPEKTRVTSGSGLTATSSRMVPSPG